MSKNPYSLRWIRRECEFSRPSSVTQEWVQRECKFAQANDMDINLTPQEQGIFDVLRAVNQAYGLNTTFRVAGGWVRDKLLGQESDDLDIALDNMTGKQLEQYVLQYGKLHPEANVGKSYTVDANAEKSKHLETTAVEINGRKIDFVNLRSEEYGNTRVPTMKMGTPETDAQRRDLTINSMFYNVNSGQVEDYVGGMKDLQTMTLRTPLDPVKTFMDDPLRMLRMLRFYSRYGNSKIAPEAVEAMRHPEVQEAYRTKVAPTRAGPEIVKLMGGDKPAEAMRLMLDTGLDKQVFDIPEMRGLDLNMDQRNKHHAHTVKDHTLLVMQNMNDIAKQEGLSKDERTLMNVATFFHDVGKVVPGIAQPKASDPNQMSYKGHEDKSVEIAEAAMKHIGIGQDDRNFVNKVIGLHMRPHVDDWHPKAIGRFLRETAIPGQDDLSKKMWKFVLLHGMADELSKGVGDPTPHMDAKRQHYKQFEEFQQRTPPAATAKPVLNGNDLMAMFPMLKPNSGFIKDISGRLLDEQATGAIQTPEQARQFVETIRVEIEGKYARPVAPRPMPQAPAPTPVPPATPAGPSI
jgi:tRNA nucleotidyltransferase/poly(A) polymerase